MKLCGVEIKSNEAIICLLEDTKGLVTIPDCRARRLTLNQNSAEDLKALQFAFIKLMEDYQVDKVVIRERATKGKFAGGALGFKIEAALQLAEGVEVELMSPNAVKEALKKNPLMIRFDETGLKSFQENAFMTAYACLTGATG
ncbi:MAG: hypothetical protein CSB48_09600 [Proteobacteria bacterium]|nr:MAG: hypothetical protein CSB48_09600 [Pseudomonadota bacterium]PIE40474.1 MAG: hypothetical protein CSA51_00560 [Gammaproteobacteria bacterium]